MFTRTCALAGCGIEFQTDNPRKLYHSTTHAALDRQRKRRRKKGGGDNGGGDGGGGGMTLFDTITPQDSRAIYVPDTCYRTPRISPGKRQPSRVKNDPGGRPHAALRA